MLKVILYSTDKDKASQYIQEIQTASGEEAVHVDMVHYSSEQELMFEWGESGCGADLVFLHMDAYSDGIELARRLREGDGKFDLCFIAPDSARALEAFDVKAIAYIAEQEMSGDKIKSIIRETLRKAAQNANTYIAVSHNDRECKVAIEDIKYFEIIDHTITMHYQLGPKESQFEFHGSMGKLENSLAKYQFVRPHRSYLISMTYVNQIKKGVITLQNGVEIPISRKKTQEFKEYVKDHRLL